MIIGADFGVSCVDCTWVYVDQTRVKYGLSSDILMSNKSAMLEQESGLPRHIADMVVDYILPLKRKNKELFANFKFQLGMFGCNPELYWSELKWTEEFDYKKYLQAQREYLLIFDGDSVILSLRHKYCWWRLRKN